MKLSKNISLFIAFFVLSTSVSFAQASLKALAKNANKSIFKVSTYAKDGQKLGSACGFFVDNTGRAISRADIFNDAYRAKIEFESGKTAKVKRLISLDPIANLALFKIRKFKKGYSYLDDEYVEPVVGEEVVMLKEVKSKKNTLDLGVIQDVINVEGFGEISILEQEIEAENNGCPVINRDGKLIGIAVSSDESSENFAIDYQNLQQNNIELREEKGEKRLPGRKRSKFPPLQDFTRIFELIVSENYSSALNRLEDEIDSMHAHNYSLDEKSIYFVKAYLEKKLEQPQEALKDYTRVMEVDPGNPLAYLERVKLKIELGDIEGAGNDLERSIDKSEFDQVEVIKLQADLYVKLKNLEAADALYKKAEGLGYNKKETYKKRARIYLELEHYQTAKDLLDIAIEHSPFDTELFVMRGEANAHLGKSKEAKEDFNQGGVHNGDLERLKVASESNLEMEDYEEAVHLIESAIEINPDDAELLLIRGKAFNKIESFEQSKTSLDILIRKDPYLSEAYYERGKAHVALRMIEESLTDFTKAIKLKPDYIDSYFERGVVFGLIGDYTRAKNDFEKVVELEPLNDAAHYNLGQALFRSKNLPGACRSWSQAAKLGDKASKKLLEDECSSLQF